MKKNKTIKRIIAVMLTLITTISMFSVLSFNSFAYGDVIKGDVRYYVYASNGVDTYAEVKEVSKSATGTIKIPSTINGVPVTKISAWNAFRNCGAIESVVLPTTITEIGDNTFEGCSSLESISLPDTIKAIGKYAFENCVSLKEITLPESVLSIGYMCFTGCSSLEKVTFGSKISEIPEKCFEKCIALKTFTVPHSVKKLGTSAFYGCSALESIKLNENLTEIGYSAFNGCTSLKEIDIPNSVVTIEDRAFNDCTSLETVNFGSGIRSLGSFAFYNCELLKEIVLPDNLTIINNFVFNKCENLEKVVIGKNTTAIESYTFGGVAIENFVLSKNTTAIDSKNCNTIFTYSTQNAPVNHLYFIGSESEFEELISSNNAAKQLKTAQNIHYNCTYSIIKESTCSTRGIERVTSSDGSYVEYKLPLKDHKFTKTVTTKATISHDGIISDKCTVCNKAFSKTPISKISKISLSKTTYTYTGKTIKPEVTVKDAAGNTISYKNYTVTYKNNTNSGTATVTITFKGNYSGTVNKTFTIVPQQTKNVKATTVNTTSIKLTWTKTPGAKYYKVEQSTDGKKWKTVATVSTNSATIKSLKAGTKYQFRVTALDASKKIAGKASAVLKTATRTNSPSITLKSSKTKTAVVSWKKVTGASKYVVYKSTDGKKWTKIATTGKTAYSLTKLAGGKKIYVKVCAVNAYGLNSAYSTVKNVVVKR